MSELRDRIARALYNECSNQDAYVETAYGKYVPDPADPEDLITVDGRLSFAELADAILTLPGIAVVELNEPLKPHGRMWPITLGCETEVVAVVDDAVEPIHISGFGKIDSWEARDLAAALLSAADYAERDQ